jgi:prepilin-type N-terminal cleavage/methylation domain-containing protein
MKFCLQTKKSNFLIAFTLIELLVSISVLAMIAAISVSSYPQFSEQLGVTTETYKVLSYMREAQVYGVSGYTDPGVKVVYGLEVDKTTGVVKKVQWQNPNNNTNQSYINNKTDTGDAVLELNDRYEIEKMCSFVGSVSSCDSGQAYDRVYIFFKRPNPEARVIGLQGTIVSPEPSGSAGHAKLGVHIRSKKNPQFVKKVVILQTGQIYTE